MLVTFAPSDLCPPIARIKLSGDTLLTVLDIDPATQKGLALLCHSLIAGHMWPAFLYLVIAFAVELLLICLCWYSVCDISQRNAMAESLRPKSWMAF